MIWVKINGHAVLLLRSSIYMCFFIRHAFRQQVKYYMWFQRLLGGGGWIGEGNDSLNKFQLHIFCKFQLNAPHQIIKSATVYYSL